MKVQQNKAADEKRPSFSEDDEEDDDFEDDEGNLVMKELTHYIIQMANREDYIYYLDG